MRLARVMAFVVFVSAPAMRPAFAQEANGETVFNQSCAVCHADSAPGSRATKLDGLRLQAAASVVEVLTTGVMRAQAQRLNPSEIRAVAEFVTGKKLLTEVVDPSIGRCAVQTSMSNLEKTPRWNGWGGDLSNTRFQTAAQAGLSAADIPKLKLKWAFGLPETSHAWSQPSVVGGRVFVGSQGGRVYALDAKTGCTYWSFIGAGAMRTTVVIGPRLGRPDSYVAYFSTIPGWVYALDANTGQELWKTRAEDHVSTRTTGSPVLHAGILYVPVASFEEGMASGGGGYECRWKQQVSQDVWLPGCGRAGGRGPNFNCPDGEVGTDIDFGSSPILATLPGGRQIIVAGQKSGDTWPSTPTGTAPSSGSFARL